MWEGDWEDPGQDDAQSQGGGFQKSKRKVVLPLDAAELDGYRSEGLGRRQVEVRGGH